MNLTHPSAEILPTHSPALFRTAVERAAALLRAGEVVALPTETVYGLAANALDPRAVHRIFEIKGRPAHNPIIVHVASMDLARACVSDWPAVADKLARAFWPGPLTVVLPRAGNIPDVVTGGGETVGVRWPSHPLMQAVIQACAFPLAAPSANPANRLSPTTARHVRTLLGSKIRLIVDGGAAHVGIESTVLDITGRSPRILRPGMIHAEALLAVTGELGWDRPEESGPLRSPGRLPKHYAPGARLVIASWRTSAELAASVAALPVPPPAIHVIAHTHIPSLDKIGRISVIPHDPEAFARAIYAELHRCDELGAEVIVIEAVPDEPRWRPIADRLQRAAMPL